MSVHLFDRAIGIMSENNLIGFHTDSEPLHAQIGMIIDLKCCKIFATCRLKVWKKTFEQKLRDFSAPPLDEGSL